MDLAVVTALAAAFALLLTAQIGVLLGLLSRHHRWSALLALLIPPSAPVLAWRAGLRVWPSVWLVAALVYGVAWLAVRAPLAG